LGQTAPTASTETLNYTVPASTSTLVKSIIVANPSASSDTFSIALVPIAATTATTSQVIYFNNTISENSTLVIKAEYTLAAGNGIRVTSTNGSCVFTTLGAEVS
jgi:hypothetical protein